MAITQFSLIGAVIVLAAVAVRRIWVAARGLADSLIRVDREVAQARQKPVPYHWPSGPLAQRDKHLSPGYVSARNNNAAQA